MTDSPSPHVSWALDGTTWTITIDRPAARNALDSSMYEAIKRGVRLGSASVDATAIVVRGTAGSFAVGGDLDAFLALLRRGPEAFRAEFEATYHDTLPWHAILEATKPVVGAIDGLCVAGGLLLAMCCDITIATTRSRFGIPEARVGIADKSTVELLVPSIGLMRTRYLALTGKMIDAATAERWGIVTLMVDDDGLDEAIAVVVEDLSKTSPTSKRAYKSMLNARIGTMPSDILMDVALTPDGLEGMTAFAEKRRPEWPSLSGDERRAEA